MEKLENRIKEIEEQMQRIEIHIDSYSLHGKQPSTEDRVIQFEFFKEWIEYSAILSELKELLN